MSCSRTQHGGGRSRTPDLSLRSPTLYHWATALPAWRWSIAVIGSVDNQHLAGVPFTCVHAGEAFVANQYLAGIPFILCACSLCSVDNQYLAGVHFVCMQHMFCRQSVSGKCTIYLCACRWSIAAICSVDKQYLAGVPFTCVHAGEAL